MITDRYAPGRASAVNVFSQPFSPTQPRKVEHGIRAEVTCSTTSSPICHRSPIRASLTSRSTVVRFSPKNPFGELTAEPCGPPVQILALEGVHGLTVAAVVLDVADEVADHTAAQTAVLGSGARSSTGPLCGCLPMPVALVCLYGLGCGRPTLTELRWGTGRA